MSSTTNIESKSVSNEVYAGLFSTLFTIGCYGLWKIVKRYTLKSKCKNGELVVSFEDLSNKIDETHQTIRIFTSEILRAYRHQQQDIPFTVEIKEEEEKKDIEEDKRGSLSKS